MQYNEQKAHMRIMYLQLYVLQKVITIIAISYGPIYTAHNIPRFAF